MRRSARLLVTFAVTGVVALVLSLLPALEHAFRLTQSDLAAFGQGRPARLTAESLVDGIAPLPMGLRIGRVDWREPILSVDLLVDDSRIRADDVYRDLLTIDRFGFASTSNVKRVLVRVLEANAKREGSQLLLTMDAWRDQVPKDWFRKNESGPVSDEQLSSFSKITYTGSWKDRFPNNAQTEQTSA